ncbi:unnamed protein product [Eruca vesicaria subsp. sativa]|uniref:Transcription repressor n=1 Tax=Eruca vesicaria subsp. sativa TaxID=29727 RepID=A0ABC8L0N0_ERUVS|nr:unnamed protein product [Eruca vesicaria subsp. sativa]
MPRRKIYDGDDHRCSEKKERYTRQRRSTSSAEDYEEETERGSLLPSSTNLSSEISSSGLPRVTRRRKNHPRKKNTSVVVEEKSELSSPPPSPATEISSSGFPRVTRRRKNHPRKKNTSVVVEEKSELSSPPPSPARLSLFVQRLIPCTVAVPVVMEGVEVVKRLEDPYEDFEGSMMEMIVEKNMFEVAELEQLLIYFLTLNTKRHHRAIVKELSEVWVALFSGGKQQPKI